MYNDTVKEVFKVLREIGHEARICGGAVRDSLIGIEPNDIDFATTARPELVLKTFINEGWNVVETGLDHGTVTAIKDDHSYEITTLRTDKNCDGRHAEVEFTDSWHEDAERRDFTINAMYLDEQGKLYDYYNGEEHLENRTVRFVGYAKSRMKEDGLRIIRLFRMMCKIEGNTPNYNEVCENIHLMDGISEERIWWEIKKVIKDTPSEWRNFLILLTFSGISERFGLPQIDLFKDRHELLYPLPGYSPEIYVAEKFRDSVKFSRFAERYKLSNEEIKNGVDFAQNIERYDRFESFGLKEAQNLINHDVQKQVIHAIASYIENGDLMDYIASDEFQKKELPVRGKDLIEVGFKPGPNFSEKLAKAYRLWMESDYTLDKQQLLSEIT